MAEVGIGVHVSDDQSVVKIEFMQDGQPASEVLLNFDQLTNLIGLLGQIRTHMLEERPRIPLEGQEVRTVYCPNWYVQVAKIDGSLLAFDHPAFGPVGFAIPSPEIAEIVRLLNGHLAMPASRAERRN